MKIFTNWMMGFLTLILITFIGLQEPFIKETLRLKSFDILFQSEEKVVSSDIGIVTIDEQSIERYGQYPWNREILGNLIHKLRQAQVGIIVMPILFSEPDRLGGDDLFMLSLDQMGVVIAQVGTTQTNKNSVPRGVAKIGDPLPWLFEWPGMLGPIPQLGSIADGVGVINTAPEIDGVVRRLPLIMRIGEETYPAMAIETIRVATGNPSYQIKAGDSGIIAVRVPGYPIINTDQHARIWLRWNNEFETVSASSEDFSSLEGKTVVVGITAEGLGSIIGTPIGEQYDWALTSSALQTVINGTSPKRYDISLFIELVISVLVGIIIVLLTRFTPYWVIGSMMLLIYGGSVFTSHWFFTNKLMLVDVSWIIIVTTIVGMHSIFNRFIIEFREKQKIKKQFAGYCSPTVVRMLQENPDLIKQGMKREISICFSDLRGFTPLGESFGDDVQGLTKLMNGYMDAITQPVLDADGMIIKYIGDASMHVHNAPNDDPHHARSAVQTGLNMLDAVTKFNEKIIAEGRPPIGMGAGINTGLGYLGEMGSSTRHSYDVLGDAVSTAARIESKCKEYGCLLLVGENTYEKTEEEFFYLKVDDLAVKGKSVGIGIYTVLATNEWAWENTNWYAAQKVHEKMHHLYKTQSFDIAIKFCNDLMNEFDGKMKGYYKMWIERCEYMKTQDLPKDWNGVFIATTK